MSDSDKEGDGADAVIGCGCIAIIIAGVCLILVIAATVLRFGWKIFEWIWS
jgi:hypothetical protein